MVLFLKWKVLILIIVVTLCLPTTKIIFAETESFSGIVENTDSLRVRSGAGTSYDVLGNLRRGDTVTILNEEGEWLQIDFNEQNGWVHSSYITINKKVKTAEISPPYATITASTLTVMSESHGNGKKVTTVHKEEIYKVIKEENSWIKIEISDEVTGWVPKWNTTITKEEKTNVSKESTITILYDSVPIRKNESFQSDIITHAKKGKEYKVLAVHDNTYEIQLSFWRKGFVAGWLVEPSEDIQKIIKHDHAYKLENKTIIIDPGHGGNDSGTIGTNGTLEKDLTLNTALLLQRKLEGAGATVILTRDDDNYVSLSNRVKIAQRHKADAFISLHYDSAEQEAVEGITQYYFHPWQQGLAKSIEQNMVNESTLKNRGVRYGNYQVLRTNSQPSVLLELGYLSNPTEEAKVTSIKYQHALASTIYNGIGSYFIFTE